MEVYMMSENGSEGRMVTATKAEARRQLHFHLHRAQAAAAHLVDEHDILQMMREVQLVADLDDRLKI